MFGTFFCATSVVTQDTAKIDWEAMRVIQLVMVADKYDSNALLTRKPMMMVTNNGQPGNRSTDRVSCGPCLAPI